MGDFLLDLRPRILRQQADATAELQFSNRTRMEVIDEDAFALTVTFTGTPGLCAPYRTPDGSVFAVAGMVAFEEDEWRAADRLPGGGGLMPRTVCHLYKLGGVAALERLNGNYVVFVYDAPRKKLFFATDPAGAFPVFECERGDDRLFGSHPDVLARAAGEQGSRDEVSLAEFLIASTVTPPFTYYKRVRALDPGCIFQVDFAGRQIEKHRHFVFTFDAGSGRTEEELARELAEAIRGAVRRRASPRFGTLAVALSGGLDSRLLLAALPDPGRAFAFTCFDSPNRELDTAVAVAHAAGVRFVPLQRSPDYYGENAGLGVRVSGGMGTFANNHFLGVLERLHQEGMQVMLTGCYCDYLFKGLPLNRSSHWLTGREHLAPFSHQFYFPTWVPDTGLARQVRERWEARCPPNVRQQQNDASLFDLEVRRTFPLCYEGDNQQRVVPQRLAGWFVPLADRDVLEVYRRIPARLKLNRSIFLKAARLLLAESPIGRVPDANTGAPINASPLREWFSVNRLRLARRLKSHRGLASDGSWPDWDYYLTHSPRMAELWRRPNPEAFDFFRRVMNWQSVPRESADFQDGRVFQFVPLLTQKIWFEQRACSNA